MDPQRIDSPRLDHPLSLLWQHGLRLGTRLAIGLGLAAVAAVVLGAAVTDNGFVQIVVTLFAALAFWLPFTVGVYGAERLFKRGPGPRGGAAGPVIASGSGEADAGLARLLAAAPVHSERIAAIRSSLAKSRTQLGRALDPDTQELCVLIDRRLPELIDRELESLPAPGAGRNRRLGELVDLVEQFAGHCGAKRLGMSGGPGYDAAVLRRRFEARLAEF